MTFNHIFCQQNKDFYGYTVFTIEGVRFVTEKDATHVIKKLKQGQHKDAFLCDPPPEELIREAEKGAE